MAEVITVTLPKEVQVALEEVVEKEGVSLNAIVTEALREYLFFRRLRLLRERMVAQAQARGIRTEEDVFRQVS
ncbi:MAG: ribbon-helix-helix protein, CopG family [Thermoflexales bacterium]|nr:ribbon-helix-helix protein, CopG family [Thermoflexales bacterium]